MDSLVFLCHYIGMSDRMVFESDMELINMMMSNGVSLEKIGVHFGYNPDSAKNSISVAIRRLGFESFLQYRRKKCDGERG